MNDTNKKGVPTMATPSNTNEPNLTQKLSGTQAATMDDDTMWDLAFIAFCAIYDKHELEHQRDKNGEDLFGDELFQTAAEKADDLMEFRRRRKGGAT